MFSRFINVFPILNYSSLTPWDISCHHISVKSGVFHISKRFTMGHVHKVLDAAMKNQEGILKNAEKTAGFIKNTSNSSHNNNLSQNLNKNMGVIKEDAKAIQHSHLYKEKSLGETAMDKPLRYHLKNNSKENIFDPKAWDTYRRVENLLKNTPLQQDVVNRNPVLEELKHVQEMRKDPIYHEPIKTAVMELETRILHNKIKQEKMSLSTIFENSPEIHDIIQELKLRKNNSHVWHSQDYHLLTKLNNCIKKHALEDNAYSYITRSEEEFYRLVKYYNLSYNQENIAVLELLSQNAIKTPYTLQQYQQEINYCKKVKTIIESSWDALPDMLILEMAHRAGVLHYNDAKGYGHFFLEAEGATITQEVYEQESPGEKILTKDQREELIQNYESKNYQLFILNFPFSRKIVESSEERHLNSVTTYTREDGSKGFLIFGHPTSNTDFGTIFITPKQFINEESIGQKKTQRFRLLLHPIEITEQILYQRFYNRYENSAILKNLLESETRFTDFFKNNNYEGYDVHNIILKEIQNKYSTNPGNSNSQEFRTIKQPRCFDRVKLKELTLKFYEDKLDEFMQTYKKKEIKYKSFSEDKKLKEDDLDYAQYKNDQEKKRTKYCRAKMSDAERKILTVRDELTERHRKHKQLTKKSE